MAGISGSGIDNMMFPNPYKADYKDSAAYGREAGAATGAPGGARAGSMMARRDMRDKLALQRIQSQQQQGQAYSQLAMQLAQLAAYMKYQNQGAAAIPPETMAQNGIGAEAHAPSAGNMFGVFNEHTKPALSAADSPGRFKQPGYMDTYSQMSPGAKAVEDQSWRTVHGYKTPGAGDAPPPGIDPLTWEILKQQRGY